MTVAAGKVRGLFPEVQTPDHPKTTCPPLPSERNEGVIPDSSGSPSLPSSRTKFDDLRKTLGDLTEMIKAACHLAVVEVRKALLTKVTLPAAYLALGRDIFFGGRFRSEFRELYAEINHVQAKITSLTTVRSAGKPSGTFAEKVGQTASKIKDTAQVKALGFKLNSLMRRLGEAGYSRFKEKSGPETFVQPIRECLNKIEILKLSYRQNRKNKRFGFSDRSEDEATTKDEDLGELPHIRVQQSDFAAALNKSSSNSLVASPPISHDQDQRIATWVFGSILFTFFLGVFLFAPKELPEFKQRMLAFSSALLAGFFGFFFTGQLNLEIKFIKPIFGDLGVKATGGAGLFVLVLSWWLSPFTPVKPELAFKPIEYDAAGNLISVLANDVKTIEYSFDGKIWRQAEEFGVTPTRFVGVDSASARLNSEERSRHTKVFIKYVIKSGTESAVKEIDYNPKKLSYPDQLAKEWREEQEAKHLVLEGKRLSGSDLDKIGKNSKLETLALIRCEFDDGDLEALQPMSNIEDLDFSDSSISDEGFKHICRVHHVTKLNLSGTKVTDRGITYIKTMWHRGYLNLNNTRITGSGFASIHSQIFTRLSLRGSRLNDEGALYLGTTRLNDAGQPITALSLAVELDLGETPLTDTGLRHLESSTLLEKLKIDGTKVTAAGVDSLKKKIPQLEVEW
jgi:Leucine-rich repeat (LRR) protein